MFLEIQVLFCMFYEIQAFGIQAFSIQAPDILLFFRDA